MPKGSPTESRHKIGVISDTHGLIRPSALKALQGVEKIIHAGDIGKPEVLEALAMVAPVVAVRGNVDKGSWAEKLPPAELVDAGEVLIYVIHDISKLDLDPVAASFRAVISGHSHRPSVVEKRGVLFLNPGSAGPRRFKLPVSLAVLNIQKKSLITQLIELEI